MPVRVFLSIQLSNSRKLTARIESVFLRGTQVVKDHQVVVEKAGKFVKRGRYAL